MIELTAARPGRARSGRRLVIAGGYVLLVLACFAAGFLLVPRPDPGQGAAVWLERTRLPQPQPVGEFVLEEVGRQDGTGRYTRDRLVGQWTLMYFGYSHCPDICRPTLAVLAEVARALRAAPDWTTRVELVFVTVDPVRDTQEVLRAYLSKSDSELVGLRGSEKQIAALAQQLGLLYARGDADPAGNYLVDHPATILLVDPAASLRAGFPLPHDPGRIAEQVLEIEREFAAGRAG